MKRSRAFSIVTTLVGVILGVATLGFVFASDAPVTAQANSTLARQAIVPLLAADDAPGAPPATATATVTGTPLTGAACGEERWPVKTLSDADYGQVNFTPIAATVHSLRQFVKPGSYPDNSRVSDVERTTYTASVTLVSMKLEDDRDIHLVVADPSTSETMIVEFPDVACSGAINSGKKAEMQAARNALVAACGNAPSSSFKSLSGTATLTGVGFFDVIHGQTGVAPNGIELHPILSFSGTCGSSSSTPTATTAAPAATPTTSTTGDSNGPWYTSSFGSATYYYCAADPGWRGLSSTYLRSYPTEAALLADWGGRRTKHPYASC